MASVTQTIPTLWGGVSQQSDELKLPGQVNKALNVLPDVTQGLNKRPGSRLVGGNITGLQKPMFISEGTKWFHYYRDKTEQYIGRIDLTTGDIKMFLCSDGSEKTVVFDPTNETAIKDYLKQGKSLNPVEYVDYGTKCQRPYMSNTDVVIITLRDENETAITHDLKVGDVIQYRDANLTSYQWQDATITYVSQFQIRFLYAHNITANATSTTQVRRLKNTDIIASDIQTLTLNDNTFICNRNKTVTMDPTDIVAPITKLEAVPAGNTNAIIRFFINNTSSPVVTKDHNLVVGDKITISGHFQERFNQTLTLSEENILNSYSITYPIESSTGVVQSTTTLIKVKNHNIAPIRPPEAIIELKQVKYASQYAVNLFDTETTQDVITSTRIDVEKTDTDESDTCPHVDTQIFNITNLYYNTALNNGFDPTNGGFIFPNTSITGNEYRRYTDRNRFVLDNGIKYNDDNSGGEEQFFLSHGNTGGSNNDAHWKLEGTITNTDGTVHTISFVSGNFVGYGPYGGEDYSGWSNGAWLGAGPLVDSFKAGTNYSSQLFTIEQCGVTATGTGNPGALIVILKNNEDSLTGTWTLRRCNADGTLRSDQTDPVDYLTGETIPFIGTEANNWSGKGVYIAYVQNSSKKDLYFRVTTTGQSVATGASDAITYKCRYTTTYDLLFGGSGWATGDTINISMKSGSVYKITIQETSTAKIQANLGLIRPTPTAFDSKTVVTAESILGALRTEIAATQAFADADVEIIGNSLYLTRSAASGVFNITTPVGELLNVLTNEVQDIADLPNQCKHGYVVKVTNSAADEDDYFLKFVGKQKDDGTFLDGDGVWEECPEPGRKVRFDYSTMPVVLVRTKDGNFRVSQLDGSTYSIGGETQPAIDQWEDCPVGSSITAPEPSFVGHTINNLIFFRNRLAILSDENIILSRPGDFFHFWPKSAITFSQGDNIDLAVSSEYPATIYDAIPVNTGLILFTPNKQFMLTTDSDLLTAQTAKINSISNYNYNYETNPFSLGTTIGFMDNAGAFSRFFEMTAVLREGEPEVIENSKIVPKFLPKELNLVADSRENTTLFFGVKNTDTLFGYRYLTSTEKRIQSAWFEWKLSGRIQYVCMLDDSCYVVIENATSTTASANSAGLQTIQRFDLVQDDTAVSNITSSFQDITTTTLLTGTDDRGTTDTSDDRKFTIHLDNAAIPRSNMSYNSTTGLTTFETVSGFNNRVAPIAAIQITDTTNAKLGKFSLATYDSVNNSGLKTYNYTLVGEFTDIVYGYLYDMEVLFPNFFVQAQTGQGGYRSDRHASLVIHRAKLSFSEIGECKTILKRLGKSDFPQTHAAIQGGTDASGIDIDEVRTIPIYEKNTNCTLTVKSTHPTPTRLQSLSWEGDYTNKFYRRV